MDDVIDKSLMDLWQIAGLNQATLTSLDVVGREPVLPGIFRVGSVASVSIAACAAAAAELWWLRTGRRQSVSVDMFQAAVMFRSERYLLVNGKPPPSPWGILSGYFRTGDDRVVQLHANFPQHQSGFLKILGIDDSQKELREKAKAALRKWTGQEFEERACAEGLCAGLLRSREEWQTHPQGQAVAGLPLLEIEKIGDSPPEPLPEGNRPLAGVRALDLTRIIAGPVCGRTLAAHGADVLRLASAQLPFIPHLWLDHARGKHSAHLDLDTDDGRTRLSQLVESCDIFCQAYRPGALEARGFGPERVAELRPGVVYVTLSAFGHEGPWADRRGFDSLVQTVSGLGEAGARASGSRGTLPLPCQALDHATGYLAAFGAMAALARRAREGGSWRVRVSLAQTGHWLWQLGQIDGLECPQPNAAQVAKLCETIESSEGSITAVRPAEKLSETPAYWHRAATPLGADEPVWQH